MILWLGMVIVVDVLNAVTNCNYERKRKPSLVSLGILPIWHDKVGTISPMTKELENNCHLQ
jgi:hypothetical protein